MVLYGVWIPDYSNSSVHDAVYTTRDDADAVARALGGYTIEFEIDRPLGEEAKRLRRPGERFYNVLMQYDGSGAWTIEDFPKEESKEENIASDLLQRINFTCWARDEQHAIKIVNERRARWIVGGRRRLGGEGNPDWAHAII